MQVKVYVIQRYDKNGNPGEVIDVKLSFAAAHDIAKKYAPAKVLYDLADKSDVISKPVPFGSQPK
jgi:hypothetical protein